LPLVYAFVALNPAVQNIFNLVFFIASGT